MRVLVTGSSGQLGSTIVAMLRNRRDVIVLDLAPAPTTQHVGAIEDQALLEGVFHVTR